MIDADIQKLSEQDTSRSLDHLEADIWAGVAAQSRARKAGRLIVSCQMAVMATAMVGSVAAGAMTAASAANSPPELSRFSSRTVLTPSTLLLGSHR